MQNKNKIEIILIFFNNLESQDPFGILMPTSLSAVLDRLSYYLWLQVIPGDPVPHDLDKTVLSDSLAHDY